MISNKKISLSKKSNSAESKRIRDISLDFNGIPAGAGIHSIHSYPAMFHPMLVRQFVESYTKTGEYVLDPFMGSGVAAVESSVTGRRFYGFDLNPLAVLIAKVRTTPIKTKILENALSKILDQYKVVKPNGPNFMNINFWFSRKRIDSISKILKAIESINDHKVKNFFKTALSKTIRTVSFTNPNEFKLVRRKKPCDDSTLLVFEDIARKNIVSLSEYYSDNRITYSPHIELRNILNGGVPLKNEGVSLLITSPPYGDSQTTVAYGQFSRLSLQWLGLPHTVDKESLGAKAMPINNEIPSPTLYESLSNIEEKDIKRAEHVYSFYYELFQCIKRLVPKIKKQGHIIFVVGNRTVKGIQLPTDVICAEIFESFDYKHKETRIRQIGNKRMPSENSPTNIVGKKSSTMRYEYIVVCKRI